MAGGHKGIFENIHLKGNWYEDLGCFINCCNLGIVAGLHPAEAGNLHLNEEQLSG